jgi:hypothetical protein
MEHIFVPSIPMLHTSYLGPHLVKFGVDDGSFGHQLTCDARGVDASIPIHPKILLDIPVDRVHATMTTETGRMIWDAVFNAAGTVIKATDPPIEGALPIWPRLCTPPGKTEMFDVKLDLLNGASTFTTHAQFVADHPGRPPLVQRSALPVRRSFYGPPLPSADVVQIPFSVTELKPPASGLTGAAMNLF